MDELEATLSPSMQMTALSAIYKLCEDESQMIIATHSPILLVYPYSKIYQFTDTSIKLVQYEETDHYWITKDFKNCYGKRVISAYLINGF